MIFSKFWISSQGWLNQKHEGHPIKVTFFKMAFNWRYRIFNFASITREKKTKKTIGFANIHSNVHTYGKAKAEKV